MDANQLLNAFATVRVNISPKIIDLSTICKTSFQNVGGQQQVETVYVVMNSLLIENVILILLRTAFKNQNISIIVFARRFIRTQWKGRCDPEFLEFDNSLSRGPKMEQKLFFDVGDSCNSGLLYSQIIFKNILKLHI